VRHLCTVAVTALIFATACAKDDNDEPACQIAGTYSDVDTRVSGDCPITSDASLVTISANGPSAWFVEIQGVSGGCNAQTVSACKIQGKCDFSVVEPVSPDRNTGTIQFSWTFDASGFRGTSAVSIPPIAAVKTGCSSEASAVGTRR
jgi:hypothetical protein